MFKESYKSTFSAGKEEGLIMKGLSQRLEQGFP